MRVVLAIAVLALAAAPAAAHAESEAAAVWRAQQGTSLVTGAGHRPEAVAAGTQWTAHLDLADPSAVRSAGARVCVIDELVCVIPPQNATATPSGWAYDTASFSGVDGRPYAWRAGSRVGTQWLLSMADGASVVFPSGLNLTDPACEGRAVECFETGYLAFDVAASPGETAPLPAALPLVAVAAAALARRALL